MGRRVGVGCSGVKRHVFFKCHDCKKAFWKKALPPPRDNFVQHFCLNDKVSTRRFGAGCRTCTQNHGDLPCVMKISKSDYLATEPNCGCYVKHLANGNSQGEKKRALKKKSKKMSGAMSDPVKNILVENKRIHKMRKKKLYGANVQSKSVWDPGCTEESTDDFKVPPKIARRRSSSIVKEFLFPDQELNSLKTKPIDIQKRESPEPIPESTSVPLSKRRRCTLPGLPSPVNTISPFASPLPFSLDRESEEKCAMEPVLQTIDKLIADGVCVTSDNERCFTKEENDILAEIDLGLASETKDGKITSKGLKNSKS